MIFHKQILNVQFGTKSIILGTGNNFVRLCESVSDIPEGHVPTPDDVNHLAPEINLHFPNAESVEPLINTLLLLKEKLVRQDLSKQIADMLEGQLKKETETDVDECCGCGDPDCSNETSLAGDEEPT